MNSLWNVPLSRSIYCWLGTDCSQPTLQSRSIKITLFPSFTLPSRIHWASEKKYSNHVLDNFLSIFLMHTPKHPHPIDIIYTYTIFAPKSLEQWTVKRKIKKPRDVCEATTEWKQIVSDYIFNLLNETAPNKCIYLVCLTWHHFRPLLK